jgi:carboxyl-terminal processing protease
MTQFYRPLSPESVSSGARTGIVAYLKERGIGNPQLPLTSAHLDRWRGEDEVVRYVALSLERYGTRVDTGRLVDAAISGELAATNDPYSVLFRPKAYHGFVSFLDGTKFGGIGVELALDENPKAVRIDEVFPGSPAEKAGLRENDTLVSVDGKPVNGLDQDALRALLRGKVGTSVQLAIRRDGVALAQPLTVVRATISPPDVIAHELPGNVAYLRLSSFGASSGDELAAALARLQAAGARAYVLDLRENGGGYRDAAIDVASHFIRSGPVVTTQERSGPRQVFEAKAGAKIDGPLAVLVNGNTASASEIVAGAIQDDAAGTLVGERTFGKGLVQEIYPLPDGSAMKLTVARYFTPKGRDIDRVGIAPDVPVAQNPGNVLGVPGNDAQLDRALTIVAPRPAPSK